MPVQAKPVEYNRHGGDEDTSGIAVISNKLYQLEQKVVWLEKVITDGRPGTIIDTLELSARIKNMEEKMKEGPSKFNPPVYSHGQTPRMMASKFGNDGDFKADDWIRKQNHSEMRKYEDVNLFQGEHFDARLMKTNPLGVSR